MSISLDINNDDLLKALKQLPKNIQKNVLVGAVRAGAKPLVDAAKANVPEDTGNLKKSIGINRKKTKDKNEIAFVVSPRKLKSLPNVSKEKLKKNKKAGGYYAHMVEFGTSKQAANPFMRKAFESQSDESINETRKYLAERLDKEIEKAKR